MAALALLQDVPAPGLEITACATSAEVFERVVSGAVDGAVLPIENSLHGSVAEHYDLLLAQPVRIARESLLRIRHNLIVRPGVAPADVKRVMSHPVALSQCRHWLAAHPWFEVINFYDTAGSVKHLMAEELDDTAGIAPELAARQYGAEVLIAGIEDHAENFTRFHLLLRDPPSAPEPARPPTMQPEPTKPASPSASSTVPARSSARSRSSPAPESTSPRSSRAPFPAHPGSTSSSSTCASTPPRRSTPRWPHWPAIATW